MNENPKHMRKGNVHAPGICMANARMLNVETQHIRVCLQLSIAGIPGSSHVALLGEKLRVIDAKSRDIEDQQLYTACKTDTVRLKRHAVPNSDHSTALLL